MKFGRFRLFVLILLLVVFVQNSLGNDVVQDQVVEEVEQEVVKEESVRSGVFPDYQNSGRTDITNKAKAQNFGAVYAFQWAFYLVSQAETIDEDGTLEYGLTPEFDRDDYSYNVVKHSLVGNYYYLFYRSREYTVKDSFYWSFASSLAFEFTIEILTENPSYQDIYQTPVFGIVVGVGFEKASEYFHSLDTWYGKFLGYLFNPMPLIPQFADKPQSAALVPIVDDQTVGLSARVRF